MPSDTLRARVLYYYARCYTGARRLDAAALAKLLEWDEGEAVRFSLLRALRELPDDVAYDVDGDGVTLEFRPSGSRRRGPPPIDRSEDVAAVFAYWRERTGRTQRVVLDDARRALIEARLAEGWTVDELRQAVDGLMADPFWTGQNDRGTPYTGVQHAFKDASRVERLIETARRGDAEGQNTTRAGRAARATQGRAARQRTAPDDR